MRKDVNGDGGNDEVSALDAAVAPLEPGAGGGSTGAPEKDASTAASATQEEAAGSEVSADKNDMRISSKLLAMSIIDGMPFFVPRFRLMRRMTD